MPAVIIFTFNAWGVARRGYSLMADLSYMMETDLDLDHKANTTAGQD